MVELLVVISIITVLAGLLVPLGKSLLARSRAINCSQNLRQIGLATMSYATDNNWTLPVTTHQRSTGGQSWTLTLKPYTSVMLVFKCHEDANISRNYTYLINDFLTPNPAGAPDLNYSILTKIDRPQATILFAEAATSYSNSDHFHFTNYSGGTVPPAVFESQVAVNVHAGKANYLFVDGHVETLSWQQVQIRLGAKTSQLVDPSRL